MDDDQNNNRRVGLLGGSFNPAHAGHREISLAALDRMALDVVWWLVTPGNPLKDQNIYAPLDERLAQARKIADHCDIVVSNFEQRHNLQYTVDTLTRLKELNPNTHFIWLMGADSLAGFHRWRDWKTIAALMPMAVFSRPGYSENALQSEAATHLKLFRKSEENALQLASEPPPAWIFFDHTDNPLSSTALRNQRD